MLVDIIRAAVLRAEGSRIDEATSGDTQISREMLDLANEVATDIMRSHDWRDLTKVHSITADGVTAGYPKPADFDRLTGDDEIAGYRGLHTVDEWVDATQGNYTGRGGWIILGGLIQFAPAISGTIPFAYISNHVVRLSDGSTAAEFDADDNEFILDDRLLTLGLIWRWKAQKGLDYSEDMATYEIALAQAQTRDRGAYVLRTPRLTRGLNRWNTTPFPAAPAAVPGPGSSLDTDYVAIYQQAQQ